MTMFIRTYYEKGLVFYISSDADNEFISVQLQSGSFAVVYEGEERTVKVLRSSIQVSNGMWHKVCRDLC